MIVSVTPRRVRLAGDVVHASAVVFTIFALLKVIVGCFSTSKKSGDVRCLSRVGSLVLMLVAWIVNSTEEFSGFARSSLMVPAKSWNLPPTLVTMWRTWESDRRVRLVELVGVRGQGGGGRRKDGGECGEAGLHLLVSFFLVESGAAGEAVGAARVVAVSEFTRKLAWSITRWRSRRFPMG